MSIGRMLGALSKAEFVERFFLQQPYAERGTAAELARWGDWPLIARALASPGVDALVARRGELWPGTMPPSLEQAQQLSADGYTIVIRHIERHDPDLMELAAGFAADFGGEVNIHLYCTPGDNHGFGWHYDAEEVFILQASGCKEYSIRKNTVNPWPLVETLPADMQYERENTPMMKCELRGGDWLYIPTGHWHVGQASETAISFSIGVLPPTAMDVLTSLRRELLSSLLWRQRLPVAGDARCLSEQELEQLYEQVFRQLGRDLADRLACQQFIHKFTRPHEPAPQPTTPDTRD